MTTDWAKRLRDDAEYLRANSAFKRTADGMELAAMEIERLRSTEFKGLGLNNWTCPHCRKQSDVGPFTVTMKL